MTVTVVTTRDDSGAPATREVYQDGDRYAIADSNLNIYTGGGTLLGTYGSGNWLQVWIGDSVEFITPPKPEGDEDSSSDFSFDSDDSSSDFSFDSDDSSSDSDDSSDDSSNDSDDSSDDSSDFSLSDDSDTDDAGSESETDPEPAVVGAGDD